MNNANINFAIDANSVTTTNTNASDMQYDLIETKENEKTNENVRKNKDPNLTAEQIQLNDVLVSHGLGKLCNHQKLTNGLCNQTWQCTTKKGKFIVQKIASHKPTQFTDDYTHISAHLRTKDILLPRLFQIRRGSPYMNCLEEKFCVFEFIPNSAPKIENKNTYQSAGLLLGRVHAALALSDYVPKGGIPNFHNATHYKQKLQHLSQTQSQWATKVKKEIAYVTRALTDAEFFISANPANRPYNKVQLIHGDPKINNILFESLHVPTTQYTTTHCVKNQMNSDQKESNAITIIDWETCMRTSVYVDLGDALRSFCRTTKNTYDIKRENWFLDGYAKGNPTIDVSEKLIVRRAVSGQIAEVAARYLIDSFEQSYFRYEQGIDSANENLKRCQRGIDYHRTFMGATQHKLLRTRAV